MTYMPLEIHLPRAIGACDLPKSGSLDVEAARQLILAGVAPLAETEQIPVAEANGRIAADDFLSPTALPRFDSSAMDGYALHATDLTATDVLAIRGRVQAGQGDRPSLLPGTVVRVTTGAAIPPGTAAVVPDEDVDPVIGAGVRMRRLAGPGANIRWRGEDTHQGDILIKAGSGIDARHQAIMRAAGVSAIDVRRRPRVALLSVGNELVEAPDEPVSGQIIDVNRILLNSLLAAGGAEIIDLGIAGDSVPSIAQRLSILPDVDVLVTTGGIAGSECDITARGIEAIGGAVFGLHLNLKPGRSMAFGRLDRIRTLHLPGNPLAALVSAKLFAMPMLQILAGSAPERTDMVAAGEMLRHRPGRTEFVLAKLLDRPDRGSPVAVRAGKTSSANLRPLCEADGFLEIPAADGDISEGHIIRFHRFEFA